MLIRRYIIKEFSRTKLRMKMAKYMLKTMINWFITERNRNIIREYNAAATAEITIIPINMVT